MKKLMFLGLVLAVSFAAIAWVAAEFMRPVHGQGTLTNADIIGSYAFTLAGTDGDQIQLTVPGTLNVGNPLNSFGPGSPNCPSPPNQFPCTSVNFADPMPQFTFPVTRPLSIVGTFVADGNGNITGGSGFAFQQRLQSTDGVTYTVQDHSCNFTLTGTYSLTTAGNTLTINPVGPCINAGESAIFTLLPGNAERKDGVEFGAMYLTSPMANPGSFSTFLNGSFFKQ